MDTTTLITAFIIPARDVKIVKSELETRGLLNKQVKIAPWNHGEDAKLMLVPTAITVDKEEADHMYIESLRQEYECTIISVPQSLQQQRGKNVLHEAVREALHEIPNEALSSVPTSREELLSILPVAHSIYAPLLLLPFTLLEEAAWKMLLDQSGSGFHAVKSGQLKAFFAKIAEATSTTHVAINAAIPTDINTATTKSTTEFTSSNTLRSPTNLVTLYGDFGPLLPPFPDHVPSSDDFAQAFWASTMQNGIRQTWAPRYTMFSKGNVTEKARLLKLESVVGLKDVPWTAVDLFAGIGYFAFSYARAGASRVLCWDLNPWSIEGLRRGAAMNKWEARLGATPQQNDMSSEVETSTAHEKERKETKLLAFCESNAMAYDRMEQLRASLPPVRHVNCGMLPDAGRAWQTAVKCLDWRLGGWLHLHETVRQAKIAERAEEMRVAVEQLLHELCSQHGRVSGVTKQVTIAHVESVKSVGPRMIHIVVDLSVSGSSMVAATGGRGPDL